MAHLPKTKFAYWALRIAGGLLFTIVIIVAYVSYKAVSTAINAEHNLHHSLFVVRLVEEYVQTNQRWPSSWQELEAMPFDGNAYAPANGELKALRVGGARDFNWPEDAAKLQQRIRIDFNPDVPMIASQDRMNFTAIEPIGPTFEFRDYGTVESLQQSLRQVLEDTKH